ncbi:hypothetical protein ACFOPX_06575 [Helicobacter baculiformis]|uniref:Uncharacterized protein n=1 Tax=Helicobacter baculiformis TaxID=427351 RepID=A0ABV7ZJ39_9HELI
MLDFQDLLLAFKNDLNASKPSTMEFEQYHCSLSQNCMHANV